MTDKMMDAYSVAKKILDAQMPQADRELLGRMRQADVVVVRGCYDRVEDVLNILEVPFLLVDAEAIRGDVLRPEQLLIVNCPGKLGRSGITAVRNFVADGGSLITTDWALRHVIEPAFPGYIEYNERPTGDEVVRIEIRDKDHTFLQGVHHEGADPLWWLEGSSYPIRVVNQDKVKVLMVSRELGERYGEQPVAVTFEYGKGEVFHMISHYYLQRAETRTARHQANWTEYAGEVGLTAAECASMPAAPELNTSELEAAHTSLKMMQNLVTSSAKRRAVK